MAKRYKVNHARIVCNSKKGYKWEYSFRKDEVDEMIAEYREVENDWRGGYVGVKVIDTETNEVVYEHIDKGALNRAKGWA